MLFCLHIKEPLLLIGKCNLCSGGSRHPLSVFFLLEGGGGLLVFLVLFLLVFLFFISIIIMVSLRLCSFHLCEGFLFQSHVYHRYM